METRKDITFILSKHDRPTIIPHPKAGCVSLFLHGTTSEYEGFSIQFLPAHLALVQELQSQLSALDVAQRLATIGQF